MANSVCIAIDGPVASGKTVVGRLIASRLGFRFLDTGMMYRAVTWVSINREIDPEDDTALSRLARSLDMHLIACESGDRLFVDGKDITNHLRDANVEHDVSLVSRVSGVRLAMVEHQRSIAKEGPLVMVGRDIGTVVLPNAGLKIFLKASVEIRAQRRHSEMVERGIEVDFDEILAELRRRDKLDTERADSPLMPADDAIQINTDNLDIDSVTEKILALVKSR